MDRSDIKDLHELERALSSLGCEKITHVTSIKLQPSLLAYLKRRYGNVSRFLRECVIQRLEKELDDYE